jgi:hypothetical protein
MSDFGATDIASNQSRENVDFCHVNDFDAPSSILYQSIPLTDIENVTAAVLLSYAEVGQPFVVRNIAREWKAREKWNEQYFQTIFADFELFSSTFATNASPVFGSLPKRDVYYGIFINDKKLADFMSGDYMYPRFIPEELHVQGEVSSILANPLPVAFTAHEIPPMHLDAQQHLGMFGSVHFTPEGAWLVHTDVGHPPCG